MSNKKFTKPSLSLDEQINFLKKQGLLIDDEASAQHALKVIGYYRLSGYFLPFKLQHQSNHPRQSKPNTTFNCIWQLYQFDRELRLLVSDAIEKIEVAFRAAISEIISNEFGIFGYILRELYRDNRPYENLLRDIHRILKDESEVFIQHYKQTYVEPEYPPIWMMVETFSFGTCSKLFTNIQALAIRRKICEVFNQHPTIIESWMKMLVWIRNLCAHHARLWNRWLVDAPIIPKTEHYHGYLQEKNRRFIACAYIIIRLLDEIAPNNDWQRKLYDLFNKYNDYPGVPMGFSDHWQQDYFWQLFNH